MCGDCSINRDLYLCGTPFWTSESGVLFPCPFFCLPDEPNRSFSFEGTFISNYNCISMMDVGKFTADLTSIDAHPSALNVAVHNRPLIFPQLRTAVVVTKIICKISNHMSKMIVILNIFNTRYPCTEIQQCSLIVLPLTLELASGHMGHKFHCRKSIHD
jgi:hypothetical protein